MTDTPEMQEAKAVAMYNALSTDKRENIYEALLWATDTLKRHSVSADRIDVIENCGGVSCEFSDDIWAGRSHISRPMGTGAKAVCMAVCEYLNNL